MKRSFDSLSPQEVLEVGISIEERNAEIYSRFVEMFSEFGDQESLEIAAIFGEMAIEEKCHRDLLQNKHTEQYGDAPCLLTEEDLVELIEVPRLENGDILGVENDVIAARKGALQVALHAELGAQAFYAKLAEQTPNGSLRQIYCDLAQMEDGHVASLKSKLAQHAVEDLKA